MTRTLTTPRVPRETKIHFRTKRHNIHIYTCSLEINSKFKIQKTPSCLDHDPVVLKTIQTLDVFEHQAFIGESNTRQDLSRLSLKGVFESTGHYTCSITWFSAVHYRPGTALRRLCTIDRQRNLLTFHLLIPRTCSAARWR